MKPPHTTVRSPSAIRSVAVENGPQLQDWIVIGLGSPHGDDQVGWLVADEISRGLGSAIVTRNLTCPIDLTLAIEGMPRVVIVDAVRCDRMSDHPCRWEWPSSEIALIRPSGTHAIGLTECLHLASELNRLPDEVVIWGIPGRNFQAGSPIDHALRNAVPRLARQIIERDLARPPEDR